MSRAATHPARKRGVGGTLPPLRGSRGQTPLGGMEGGAAPSRGAATSCKDGQLLPAAKRASDVGLPYTFACFRTADVLESPPLPKARRRLVLCGHAPALAARKKAACPVRPRTRPCRRQEGGSPGVQPPALAERKRAARLGCNPPATRPA